MSYNILTDIQKKESKRKVSFFLFVKENKINIDTTQLEYDKNESYLGTVDNNLGPDHLAGSKASNPNYCRLPTI